MVSNLAQLQSNLAHYDYHKYTPYSDKTLNTVMQLTKLGGKNPNTFMEMIVSFR